MKAYILTFVICLAAPLAGFAQREVPDTISLRCDSLAKSINIGGLVKSDNLTSYIGPTFQYAPESTPLVDNSASAPLKLNIPDFTFAPRQASIFRWTNGEFIASGGTTVYPGLMQIDSGALRVFHRFGGNFDIYVGGKVNKYGFSEVYTLNTEWMEASHTIYLRQPHSQHLAHTISADRL